jgi:hypothetical protein
MVNVPPYCGLGRLSHQFPLAAVVVVIVTDVAVVVVAFAAVVFVV